MVNITKEEIEELLEKLAFTEQIVLGGVKGTSHQVHYQAAAAQVRKCITKLQELENKATQKAE